VTRWLIAVVAAGSIATALAVPGLAQDQEQDRPDRERNIETPTVTDQTDPADLVLERMLLDQESERQRSLEPDRFAGQVDRTSQSAAVGSSVRPQRLLREGAFVVDRTGRALRNDAGDLEFVFQADGVASRDPAAAVDPPMVLVPNLNLMALESALRDEPLRRFRVTGRVTEYRGRNHLILEKVVVVD
jgi:hypothetical protein